MKKLPKIPMGTGITDDELNVIAKRTEDKIKSFVLKHKDSPLYTSPDKMMEILRIPAKFFEFRHVCMNCGDVQKMGTYAIAQTAMNHTVNYTCECGHATKLPQFKVHKPSI